MNAADTRNANNAIAATSGQTPSTSMVPPASITTPVKGTLNAGYGAPNDCAYAIMFLRWASWR